MKKITKHICTLLVVLATSSTKVVDAKGQFVMPGIIDAHSHIAIEAVNEATNVVTSEVWVGDALNSHDVAIYRALAGGVTISHAMHGSANAIGGECETIKHRYGSLDPAEMRMQGAPRTIKFALGENPMRVHGEGRGIMPRTRMGIEQVFRRAFAEGQLYMDEGFKVAPELAEFGAMASVFSDWWAYKFEVYYSTAYNASILSKNGVITSINSDSRELIRHLYHEAAKSQRYGSLTDNEALRLITINPAIQLGIDDRVGSLEVGKDGDVVIFDKHPLSIYAIPQLTIVDGIVRFDINNDGDDVRVDVDPEEEYPTSYTESESTHQHDHDSCMEGAFEYLFLGHKH